MKLGNLPIHHFLTFNIKKITLQCSLQYQLFVSLLEQNTLNQTKILAPKANNRTPTSHTNKTPPISLIISNLLHKTFHDICQLKGKQG